MRQAGRVGGGGGAGATMLFAHSRNGAGERHELGAHLRAVAELAAGFAAPFGGAELARWAGLAHDLGKASGAFQDYLAACEREPGKRHRSVDHKGVGALAVPEACGELAFLIQGHHGGLPDQATLRTILKERRRDPLIEDGRLRAAAAGFLPETGSTANGPAYPPFAVRDERSFEFFLRMCFSALVDADHLDTERHFTPERSAVRGGVPDLGVLCDRLEGAQAGLSGRSDDPVNRVRDEVYRACLAAAARPPGFFRLTVPTGGGKTRSGLAFALRHALAHDLRRVVVAVPYLTITDQTADVFRDTLGDDRAVLEHHSGAGARDDEAGEPTAAATWRRLAAQDWDAPTVVTTTVQLFESLFGRTPTACRKLHRLARSVIILDEAQALPTGLLVPILDGLSALVADYGTSVVFCTATQPAFAHAPGFAALGDIPEIAPDPPRLFRALKRVDYAWPVLSGQWTWDDAAAAMREQDRALAILNTKKDALALLDALGDPDALHLSTLLCGAHRRDVLAMVRHRLVAGQPCRLVSTQVVEAGVDLDFPLVLRALGPLDRIVQAAGRCNREGKLASGRVIVFEPEGGGIPPGPYRTATNATEGTLAGGPPDLDDPATFEAYFARLFPIQELDAKGIQALRARLAYERVAAEFRMIEDDTASVLVPYRGLGGAGKHAARVAELAADLRGGAAPDRLGGARRLMARAQPYLVSVRRREVERAAAGGLATPLVGDVWEWHGGYDDARGLTWQGRGADELVI